MWTVRSEDLAEARGLRFAVDLDSRPATVADVVRGWQGDAEFRSLFNTLLADTPFASFRWETPAVTTATAGRPFEFVLLDSPGLRAAPNRKPSPNTSAGPRRAWRSSLTSAGMRSWWCRACSPSRRPMGISRRS